MKIGIGNDHVAVEYKNVHSSCGFIWKFADGIKTLF